MGIASPANFRDDYFPITAVRLILSFQIYPYFVEFLGSHEMISQANNDFLTTTGVSVDTMQV